MIPRLILILSLFLPATVVFAQTAPTPVQSDLDGDGLAETILFLYPAAGVTHLLISPVDKPTVLAQDFVWRGSTGQEPTLSVAPNGDVRVTSGNQTEGNRRWLLIQTLAYVQNSYRIVGLTYNWFDTRNVRNAGTCDLNLLTGEGNRSLAGLPRETFTSDLAAMPVNDWTLDRVWDDGSPLPSMCGNP